MRQTTTIRRTRIGLARERGMTTAEYALGTIGVVTGAGILIALLAEPTAPVRIFWPLVHTVIEAVLHLFGVR